MKTTLAITILTMLGTLGGNAMADDSAWLVRVRAVHLSPADRSDPVGGLGASGRLTVSSKTIPEVDIVYQFTPNLAAELVLTYPQKHNVMLDGKGIGSFKHLPPTLLAQYRFAPAAPVAPYLGLGVNYTTMSKVRLLGGTGSLEHDSWGLALQAGIDYNLDKNWSLNLDVKKVQIRSDVRISGARVSTVKVDPLMVAVGVGYRF